MSDDTSVPANRPSAQKSENEEPTPVFDDVASTPAEPDETPQVTEAVQNDDTREPVAASAYSSDPADHTDTAAQTPIFREPGGAPELVEPKPASSHANANDDSGDDGPAYKRETYTPAVVEPVAARTPEPEPAPAPVVTPVSPPAEDRTPVNETAAFTPTPQVVYVAAPVEPRPRGNRLLGTLLVLAGTVLFGLIFAGIVALLLGVRIQGDLADTLMEFVTSPFFYVPIAFFVVGFLIEVLLLNRAAWWAHVLGSFFVALFVYFGSIGTLLLIADVVSMTAVEAQGQFITLSSNPILIAAAVIAREVAIWIGLGIAANGRRVKARNIADRDQFEREQAERRSDYERAATY